MMTRKEPETLMDQLDYKNKGQSDWTPGRRSGLDPNKGQSGKKNYSPADPGLGKQNRWTAGHGGSTCRTGSGMTHTMKKEQGGPDPTEMDQHGADPLTVISETMMTRKEPETLMD